MSASFLPRNDNDLVVWFNNFKTKMSQQYGTLLGFTAPELTQITNDAVMVQNMVQYKDGLKQSASTMITLFRDVLNGSVNDSVGPLPPLPSAITLPTGMMRGVFNRLKSTVARIKSNPVYSYNIGQDLGIISPSVSFNPATMQPELKVRVDAGYPKLSWKRLKADGVQIYVDRGDGNGFVELTKRVSTSYIDVHPLPANTVSVTWTYKARYFINDEEIGLDSVPVPVTVVRV